MRPFPGEPEFGPWRAEPISSVLARIRPGPGTRVVAVDGRSAGGKTTCAVRLAATVPDATVVHTDDVAWYQAFFDWAFLLSGYFDLRLWVQSDRVEARRPGLERDGPAEEPFWNEWDAEQVPFLAADRPWERADLIVAGGSELPYDPEAEMLVAHPMMDR
jgi:hypothetical protein